MEEYNSAAIFAERKREFDSDLYQNLELWDTLMKVYKYYALLFRFIPEKTWNFYFIEKSIDEIQYSDGSYDVDYVRRTSSANSGGSSGTEKPPTQIYYDPSQRKPSTESILRSDEPSVADLRYAKTCAQFKSVAFHNFAK